MELTVVIPAFNEERVIASTLREVLGYLSKRFSSYEVIVVDDGSRDRTAAAVSVFKNVKLLRSQKNRGKGHAVKMGVLASAGDYILYMDADNSTSITELDHFMGEIRNYDLVMGSRALATSVVAVSQNPFKKALGRLGNFVIRLLLGLPFSDTQCGFKLFRARLAALFRKQKIERWGFDFEFIFLAHRGGFRIHESPVRWANHVDSRVTPASYIASLVELLKVRAWYLLGKY